MKKLLLLSALLIFSCSKDDDKSNDSNSIEGRWKIVSTMDCGRNQELSSCQLESYLTLSDGIGAYTSYNNFDEDEAVIPCQVVDVFTDITYSTGPNSQSYIIKFSNEEIFPAIIDGNTLTIMDTYECREGVTITDEIKFIRN